MSAVVHLDEKTPHMHVTFVPLTEDKRLSAKEIIGNKKKLVQWQDECWKHMVSKYPELERGESASKTGREYIPPQVFKAMTRLTRQRKRIEAELEDINMFNAKGKVQTILQMLDKYIPNVEKMQTELNKYGEAFADVESLRKENEALKYHLSEKNEKRLSEQIEEMQLRRDYG